MATIDAPRAHLRHSLSSPNVRDVRQSAPEPKAVQEDIQVLCLRDFEKRQLKILEGKAENYACNICFDIAENAVVTSCGHLHCWPCLYTYMTLPSQIAFPTCPVCRSGCDLSTLTPIYGRGESTKAEASINATQRSRTLSSGSQTKPKSILDQWLAPHIYPPSAPVISPGQTPARPTARRQFPSGKQSGLHSNTVQAAQSPLFGNNHPVVIFSAGITTLCGMQILNNGGFTAPSDFQGEDNTSRMMWLLAMAIIAGVWFH